MWRPGFWVSLRPGWIWTPAHYVWTPGGYVFVNGYWDYELRHAACYSPGPHCPTLLANANWTYVPTYVIYNDFLFSSLFVRPRYCHYYFGDYYEARYEKLGFVAWFDFDFGPRCYDPLFSYYRRHHREDEHWERELRSLYAKRPQWCSPTASPHVPAAARADPGPRRQQNQGPRFQDLDCSDPLEVRWTPRW